MEIPVESRLSSLASIFIDCGLANSHLAVTEFWFWYVSTSGGLVPSREEVRMVVENYHSNIFKSILRRGL